MAGQWTAQIQSEHHDEALLKRTLDNEEETDNEIQEKILTDIEPEEEEDEDAADKQGVWKPDKYEEEEEDEDSQDGEEEGRQQGKGRTNKHRKKQRKRQKEK